MPSHRRAMKITDCVGNGRNNAPSDVLWAKEALTCLGRYPRSGKTRHGYIDRDLHQAIENYQRDRGLRCDGYMAPGGETESTVWVELARLAGRSGQ